MFEALLDILFPGACHGCGATLRKGAVLCVACFRKIPRHRTFFCPVCLARLPDADARCHNGPFFRFGAAADYGDPTVRSLVHALKFSSVSRAAEPLGALLAEYAAGVGADWSGSVVVPVPLGPRRERTRGFNQAERVARPLAAQLGLTLRTDILARTRDTEPQTEMRHADDRKRNVALCFTVSNANAVPGRRVILIDDVRASGSTLVEAARVLKSAGARSVSALVIAKA